MMTAHLALKTATVKVAGAVNHHGIEKKNQTDLKASSLVSLMTTFQAKKEMMIGLDKCYFFLINNKFRE